MSDERLDRLEAKIDHLTSRVDGLDAAVHELSIMHGDMRGEVTRIADGVGWAGGRFDRLERCVDEIKSTMKLFMQTQSAINGKLSSRDADRQQRLGTIGKRRRS